MVCVCFSALCHVVCGCFSALCYVVCGCFSALCHVVCVCFSALCYVVCGCFSALCRVAEARSGAVSCVRMRTAQLMPATSQHDLRSMMTATQRLVPLGAMATGDRWDISCHMTFHSPCNCCVVSTHLHHHSFLIPFPHFLPMHDGGF